MASMYHHTCLCGALGPELGEDVPAARRDFRGRWMCDVCLESLKVSGAEAFAHVHAAPRERGIVDHPAQATQPATPRAVRAERTDGGKCSCCLRDTDGPGVRVDDLARTGGRPWSAFFDGPPIEVQGGRPPVFVWICGACLGLFTTAMERRS